MKEYLAEYLRLSIEDGDKMIDNNNKQESDSISHQRSLIKQYKELHELSQIKSLEFVDDGFSGTNFERPAITKLLDMVKQGKINCIIVKDISRFGRNYLEVGDYLEQVFPFLGVRFISINDNYDSDNYIGTTGGLEVAFRSMLYDMYSKDLSIKMRSTLEIRRKRGDCMSPRPPFGYIHSKEDKRKLVVDSVAAKYVNQIFELASLGYTTGMIARKLNDINIPTPAIYKNMYSEKKQYKVVDNVGYWNSKMILEVIQNKVYLGMIVNKKHEVLKVGGKQYVKVPDEDRICVPDMHEPIITEAMFLAAQKVIQYKEKSTTKRKRKHTTSVLIGKLFCGACGRRLIRVESTTIPYFKCEKPDYDRNCMCPKMRLGEPEIEAVIKKCIIKETEKVTNWNRDLSEEQLFDEVNEEINKIEKETEQLKIHKQYLYEKLKTGYLNQEQYKKKINALRMKEEKKYDALKECDRAKTEIKEKLNILKDTKSFQYITREIVEAFIDKIKVYDENRIEIFWKFQFLGK